MKTKYLIITFLILIVYFSIYFGCKPCKRINSNYLIIGFANAENKENIFIYENYNFDSVKVFNISYNKTSKHSMSNDTNIIINVEDEFYREDLFNKESVKEFYVYFSENDIDTFKCTLKENIDEKCHYFILEYAKIEYKNNIYICEEIYPNDYFFELQKIIENE